jgi:hypothetical protein
MKSILHFSSWTLIPNYTDFLISESKEADTADLFVCVCLSCVMQKSIKACFKFKFQSRQRNA